MMPIGWSSAKKKVGIGRLIDWLVGIPSLLEFRHCEALKKPKQSHFIKPRMILLNDGIFNEIAPPALLPRNDGIPAMTEFLQANQSGGLYPLSFLRCSIL